MVRILTLNLSASDFAVKSRLACNCVRIAVSLESRFVSLSFIIPFLSGTVVRYNARQRLGASRRFLACVKPKFEDSPEGLCLTCEAPSRSEGSPKGFPRYGKHIGEVADKLDGKFNLAGT